MSKISRRYLLGGLPLLAITWPRWLGAAPTFQSQKESIGRIKIGMPATNVRRILGNPRHRSAYQDNNCTGEVDQTWRYPGLEISIAAQNRRGQGAAVSSFISTTSRRYPTSRGVAVGDRVARAERAYGKKFTTDEQILLDEANACGLVFTSRRGRIVKIELSCQVC